MMSQGDKLPVTAIIWAAVAAIIIFVNSPANVVWLTLILAAAATASTLAIWLGGNPAQNMPKQAGKAKRTDRITRLMDLLDEDEIDDLEAWLDAHRDRRLADQELMDYTDRP